MTRSQKFAYNTVASAIYQVVLMAVGVITPRVILVCYGSEVNGLVTSITQFICYFNLVEGGLSGATVYALYKPLANKDHKAINSIVSAAKKFYNMAGFVFVSLVAVLAAIYPIFVKSNSISRLGVGLLVLIIGANGALEFFTLAKYRAILSADQKTYIISIASIIHMMVNTILVVIMAKLKFNIVLLKSIALFSIFLRSTILMIYVKRKYKYISYKEEPNIDALDKRWHALYLQVLGAIQTGMPVILATFFTNLKSISIYSIFNMVISGVSGLLDIFMSGLSASFGDIIARNERKTLQKVYREFEFAYYSIITIVYSTTALTIMQFVNIYTKGIKDTDYNQPILGMLFVLNAFLYNLKTPQGMLVISAGLYKETRVQSTIQGLIVVIAGVILTPFLGLKGILIALICSNIYRDIDLILFIPKKVTKLSPKETIVRLIRSEVEIFIILVIGYSFKINTANPFLWKIYAACIFIFSLTVVCAISFISNRKEFLDVLKRMKLILRISKSI